MSETLTTAIESAEQTLAPFEYSDLMRRRVMELTELMIGGGLSPCVCAVILARTCVAASAGMVFAIEAGSLHPTEIVDRENLRHVSAALRTAADLYDAVLRVGAQ